MQDLAQQLRHLQKLHSEFFSASWGTLSSEDAKALMQIERDIMEVRAALARSEEGVLEPEEPAGGVPASVPQIPLTAPIS